MSDCVHEAFEVSVKKDQKPKTYKARWKEENREHYLQKNREYVARSRAKRKGGA